MARAVRESIEGVDGVTIKTIHADELREIGCGGLYHVGKAAAEPPRMLILSHGDVSKPSVVLAGAASRKHNMGAMLFRGISSHRNGISRCVQARASSTTLVGSR